MRQLFLYCIILFSIKTFPANVDFLLSSKNITNPKDQSLFLLDYCFANRSLNPELALASGLRAFEIAKNIEDTHLQARSSNLISVVYRSKGNFEKALAYNIQAINISKSTSDTIQLAFAENNLGHIYRLKGFYDKALEHTTTSYNLFKSVNHLEGMAFCGVNLGYTYIDVDRYEESIPFFIESIQLRKQIGDKEGETVSTFGLANSYLGLKEFDKSLEIYQELLTNYDSISFRAISKGHLYAAIGKVYLRRNEFKNSISYYSLAVRETDSTGSKKDYLVYTASIIGAYDQIEEYINAEVFLKKAIKKIEGFSDWNILSIFYNAVHNHYFLSGDLASAYSYSQKLNAINDSLTQKIKRESIESMALIFDNIQIHQENEQLLTDINIETNIRWYLIAIVLLLVLTIALAIKALASERKAKQRLDELNNVKDKFFGIVAHDLRNPFHVLLNVSQILLEENETISSQERYDLLMQVYSVSSSTNALLENLLQWSISQTKGLKLNQTTIDLQRLVADSIRFTTAQSQAKDILLKVDNRAVSCKVFADRDMIQLVIRNIISNAIKFSREKSVIDVFCFQDNNDITIEIRDYGTGISQEQLRDLFKFEKTNIGVGTKGEKGTGLGLTLAKDFIEMNKGRIRVDSEEGKGTSFFITLPLIKD